ncbi:MAG: hypothetical protein ACR2K3_04455 [Nocardioides sp.]
MSRDGWLWLGAGVAALALVLLIAALFLAGRRRTRALAAQVDLLRERLAGLERDPVAPVAVAPATAEYLITGLGTPDPERPVADIDSRLFADLVLRETVVRAASLVHGVRRGLAPETRNRIRFEMKREVRRSRKQRRADLREAQQLLRERARAGLHGFEDAG